MKPNQTIKLSESQLRDIIKESIENMLNEKWPVEANKQAAYGYAGHYVFPNGETDPTAHEKEMQAYQKMVRQFDKEFGQGAFEKAEKMRNRLMKFLDPRGKLFNLLASNSTNALNDYYTGKEGSPYNQYAHQRRWRDADNIRKRWADEWSKIPEEERYKYGNQDY